MKILILIAALLFSIKVYAIKNTYCDLYHTLESFKESDEFKNLKENLYKEKEEFMDLRKDAILPFSIISRSNVIGNDTIYTGGLSTQFGEKLDFVQCGWTQVYMEISFYEIDTIYYDSLNFNFKLREVSMLEKKNHNYKKVNLKMDILTKEISIVIKPIKHKQPECYLETPVLNNSEEEKDNGFSRFNHFGEYRKLKNLNLKDYCN